MDGESGKLREGKISKFPVKDEGVYMYTNCICDTKLAISLKRSCLEPNLLQSVYRNSCTTYRLMTNLVTQRELWPTFSGEHKFSTAYILHTSCRSATKFGSGKRL